MQDPIKPGEPAGRPFANWWEFAKWKMQNCNLCAKSIAVNGICDIEEGADIAGLQGGLVRQEYIDRMDGDEDCPEKEERP